MPRTPAVEKTGALRPRKGQGRIDELRQDQEILDSARKIVGTLGVRHPDLIGQETGLVETLLGGASGKIAAEIREASQALRAQPQQAQAPERQDDAVAMSR